LLIKLHLLVGKHHLCHRHHPHWFYRIWAEVLVSVHITRLPDKSGELSLSSFMSGKGLASEIKDFASADNETVFANRLD